MMIYGFLLLGYFLLVLRLLGEPLNQLFHLNPIVYAVATLILIVVQSFALEIVTSFMIKILKLEKLE